MVEVKKSVKEVVAKLRHLRQSSRKVRLVTQSLVGMPVGEALARLAFVPKAATTPLMKLIRSAIANAKHNFNLEEAQLFIKTFTADQGPALKRFRPAAFGQAHGIKKHSTHITLILGVKEVPVEVKGKVKKLAVKATKTKSAEKVNS
ncbi:MAG: 50S ribosomal protein L22 [Candidatus Komeilibacteria bacterium]|nr:50S ribosomal protein L22 [Candidatus Komeilibacteria bacterium]